MRQRGTKGDKDESTMEQKLKIFARIENAFRPPILRRESPGIGTGNMHQGYRGSCSYLIGFITMVFIPVIKIINHHYQQLPIRARGMTSIYRYIFTKVKYGYTFTHRATLQGLNHHAPDFMTDFPALPGPQSCGSRGFPETWCDGSRRGEIPPFHNVIEHRFTQVNCWLLVCNSGS